MDLDRFWPGYTAGILTCAIVTILLVLYCKTGDPTPEVSEYEP